MRFLHTSDWHVGKAIRGHSRVEEHRAVLAEIVEIADREHVDLVLIAGDLFETAAPSPEAERLVYRAFLELSQIAPVFCIAGNHDNPRRLGAVAPLLELGNVTLLTEPAAPNDGGVVSIDVGSTPVNIALLPFVSQRGIVRADQLMDDAGFQLAQAYSDRMVKIIAALTAGFTADAVNLVMAHAFVQGATAGGGERMAHLHDEYGVPAVSFPATANYVALGHLHRPQIVRGATAIRYSGSPLQLDFGEEQQSKQVNVVDAEPGVPAKVNEIVLTAGRPLATLRGTMAELETAASEIGDAWLRVRVNEPSRAGLADEVRELLGDGVVDVVVDHEAVNAKKITRRRDGRSPQELFAAYLEESGVEDRRLNEGFTQLYDEVTT